MNNEIGTACEPVREQTQLEVISSQLDLQLVYLKDNINRVNNSVDWMQLAKPEDVIDNKTPSPSGFIDDMHIKLEALRMLNQKLETLSYRLSGMTNG
jgi:hypothetical protein